MLGKLSEGDVEVGEADLAIVLLVYFDEVVATVGRALDDTRGFARLELGDLTHREAVVTTGKIDQARIPHLRFAPATATKLGCYFGKLAIATCHQPSGFALQLIGGAINRKGYSSPHNAAPHRLAIIRWRPVIHHARRCIIRFLANLAISGVALLLDNGINVLIAHGDVILACQLGGVGVDQRPVERLTLDVLELLAAIITVDADLIVLTKVEFRPPILHQVVAIAHKLTINTGYWHRKNLRHTVEEVVGTLGNVELLPRHCRQQ